MAVIRVKEIHERPGGGQSDWANQGNYSRKFIVTFDAVNTSEVTALAASHGGLTIPVIAEAHDKDTRSLCNSRKAVPAKPTRGTGTTLLHWSITCTYAVPPLSGFVLDPVNRPWVANITNADEEYVPKQADGVLNGAGAAADPQSNAAGVAWHDPVVETRKHMVLFLSKNVSTAPTVTSIKDFSGSVNNASITILGYAFGVRELYMETYDVSQKQNDSGGTAYYTTTFRLQYNPRTWDRYIANVGFKYLNGGGAGKWDLFVNDDGSFPSVPQRLTSAGLDGSAAALNFLQFRIKSEQTWSGFSFPGSWP